MDYIEQNKEEFIKIVNSISEERFNPKGREKLLDWLNNESDFFVAPASTKYHSNYPGGLCVHSITVYKILRELVESYLPTKVRVEKTPYGENEVTDLAYSDDTIKIVGLFHDLSKANYYEEYYRNVNTGVKDDKGRDIWQKVKEYKTKDPENRFIIGNHEETAEYMTSVFFNLTPEESMSIMHHHAGMGYDCTQTDISLIFNRAPLATLLHIADMIATYIIENENCDKLGK